MQSSNQNPQVNQPVKKIQSMTSILSNKNRIPGILLCVILLTVFTCGAFLLGKNIDSKTSTSELTSTTTAYPTPTNFSVKSNSNNNINFSTGGDEKGLDYFSGQITAPNEYLVSSDNMVTYYGSQGGMAPPRLILAKGSQALPESDSDNSYMDFGKNDCILIWSTNGFIAIEDWGQNIGRFDGVLDKKVNILVGSREASLYQTSNMGNTKFVAHLPIGNNEGTSYFFETCNLNNKADFEKVIKSIKFRPDLKL